jgi:hypothetical protein
MKSLKSCVGAASAAIATVASIQAEFATGGVISFQQIYETSGLTRPIELNANYRIISAIDSVLPILQLESK